MPQYYPKSQITPNLYTNGDEFFLKNTQIPYTGYYYKLSTGKRYTGKNPDGGIGIELTSNTTLGGNPVDPISIVETNFIRNTENLSDFDEDLAHYNNNVTLIYPNLSDFQQRTLPPPYFPQPTLEESQIGEYRRYFAKKTNELIYIEISKETYDKFTSDDPTVASDLYDCLFLPWSINDFETDPEINRKIVDLIEKNNNWVGFHHYFKGDFGSGTNPTEALYTNGGEFLLPNRTNYVGFYHFMPNGAPMTGKSHGEGSDVPLIQIKSSLPLSTPLPSTPSSPTAPTPSPTTPSYSPPSTGGGGGGY